jgi:YD repeat-containing protein
MHMFIVCTCALCNHVVRAQNIYHTVPGDTSGYTAGTYNVSESGAFNYVIPIVVSPGTNGLQPSLALVYNSQAGNGMLGMGWTLQGLGSITKAQLTTAQDGASSAATEQWRYNINGERLVSLNEGDVYGASGTEYKTEINNFSKVTSFASTGTGTTHTPSYFVERTKDGLVKYYGLSPTSRLSPFNSSLISAYMVDRIDDLSGNRMDIRYWSGGLGGNIYPEYIEYTINNFSPSSSYSHVYFEYETRSDNLELMGEGSSFIMNRRLSRIICSDPFDNVVRTYKINYIPGSGISRIQSVEECAGSNECHGATSFNWTNDDDLSTDTISSNTNLYSQLYTPDVGGSQVNEEYLSHDFNGDGILDLVKFMRGSLTTCSFYKHSVDSNGDLQIAIAPSNISVFADENVLVADFNGDGRPDIFTYSPERSLIYLNNTPNAFSSTFSFTQITNPIPAGLINSTSLLTTADFNRDGRPDILIYDPLSGTNQWMFVSNSTAQTLTFQSFGAFSYTSNLIPPVQLAGAKYPVLEDMNGDGWVDVYIIDRSNGSNRMFRNNGTGAISFTLLSPNNVADLSFLNTDYQIMTCDLYGDGTRDLLFHNPTIGDYEFIINRGRWDLYGPISYSPIAPLIFGGNLLPIDMNGDGDLDLFWYDKQTGQNRLFLNETGILFNQVIENFIAADLLVSKTLIGIGKYTGSPTFDFLFGPAEVAGSLRYVKILGNDPYMINAITNGHGLEVQVEYSSLTDFGVYSPQNSGQYPVIDFTGSLNVVKRLGSSDGYGGGSMRYASYYYEGAKLDLLGRGFRGFSAFWTNDSVTGIKVRRVYNRGLDGWKYASASLLRSETYAASPSVLIAKSINTNELLTYCGGRSYYAYTGYSVDLNYDLDGSFLDSAWSNQGPDYDCGNTQLIYSEFGDGFRDQLINQYNNDLDGWVIGRLLRSNLSRIKWDSTGFNVAEQTERASSFEYDESGRLTLEITEPDQGQLYRLQKEYTYDQFGNIVLSTTSGFNGLSYETRTITSTYDPRGRFLLSKTNALGHVTSYVYDQSSGLEIRSIDPNNLETQTEYDGFGRIKRRVFPDGNWESMDYRMASGFLDAPSTAVHLIYRQASNRGETIEFYDINNNLLLSKRKGSEDQWVYQHYEFDNANRPIVASQPYFASDSPSLVAKEYDELGRVQQVYYPNNVTDSYQCKLPQIRCASS